MAKVQISIALLLKSLFLGSAFIVSSASADTPARATQATQLPDDCYREHFPLAFAIPKSAIPPQVRFYCVAPWDMKVFQQVRSAMEVAGYDLLEAAVRSSPRARGAVIRKTLSSALTAADKGPPGMGTIYRTYFALPLLHARTFKQPIHEEFFKSMDGKDLAALDEAAKQINWKQPALLVVQPLMSGSVLSRNATLEDVVSLILNSN